MGDRRSYLGPRRRKFERAGPPASWSPLHYGLATGTEPRESPALPV